MPQKIKGMLLAALSALFFGWAGVLTKLVTLGGVSIPSILFFRGLLGACLLFLLARGAGQGLRVSFYHLKRISLLALLGTALTLLLLNLSYTYMPVGSATTVHFLYPAAVIVAESFISRQKPAKLTIIILLISTVSIAILFEGFPPGAALGLLFAGLSVFSWSFQLLYLDRSCLRQIPNFTLAFYQSCILMLVGLLAGVFSPHTWAFAIKELPQLAAISLINSVLATVLLRLGIERVGAGITAVLSVFEPVSALLFGMLLLREHLSVLQLAASGVILASITIMIWINARNEKNGTRP